MRRPAAMGDEGGAAGAPRRDAAANWRGEAGFLKPNEGFCPCRISWQYYRPQSPSSSNPIISLLPTRCARDCLCLFVRGR